nr:response regulator [Candidatus Anammoximicrobium sp.]
MGKLLIVDDEPSVCYSLEKRLRSETLEVLTAGTARLGIQMIEEHRPDVVLLDVRLPDQSGLDAFERIHDLEPQLPVIIITAHG